MLGGRILKRLGKAVIGRVVNRIQDGSSGGLLARIRDEPVVVDRNAPAVVREYQPPTWLVIILRMIVAMIDKFIR